jgi:uncharacterized protein (DUF952 family)
LSRWIYKICGAQEWAKAEQAGVYRGSADDLRDGFIHFSAADQVAATAAKYFAGRGDLRLIKLDADLLGDRLRWEPSRGGALFPHLYGELPMAMIAEVSVLPLDAEGRHNWPENLA